MVNNMRNGKHIGTTEYENDISVQCSSGSNSDKTNKNSKCELYNNLNPLIKIILIENMKWVISERILRG